MELTNDVIHRLVVDRFDVVCSSKNALLSGTSGWLTSVLHNAEFVLDIDDYETPSGILETILLKPTFLRLFRKSADQVVVASRGLFDLFSSEIAAENIHYIPNSADLDWFHPTRENAKEHKEQLILLWIGTLYENCPIDFVLRSLKGASQGIELRIVGSGPALNYFKELANSLGLSRKVRFLEAVPYSKMPEVLSTADIGLVPLVDSIYDRCKCPVKLFEYMAMELPILTTNIGEPSLIISKTQCGLATRADTKEFGQAITQMTENIDFWKHKGRAGRQYLMKHQNWDILSSRYESVLSSLIEKT